MKNIMLFLLALLMSSQVMAQHTTITGVVTDASDESPLIGANILVKGAGGGAISDLNGAYKVNVPDGKKVLVFSCIGYKTQEVTLKPNQKVLNLVMKEDAAVLDEVVVVGYGTMKKSDLTGAVSSLKNSDLMKANPVTIEQGMQGRMAGVNIIKNDGAPGGGISMQIRGTNSFLGGTEPLYVIDGVPMTTSNGQETVNFDSGNEVISRNALSFLDPSDIESIEVLKDGSSIAIYGSQGANGVVMITTKSGKEGQSKLSLDYTLTMGRVAKKLRLLGAREYADYRNTSAYNTSLINTGKELENASLPFPGVMDADGQYVKGPSDFANDPYYWQDVIFKTSATQNYALSYSGGGKDLDYSISASYLDQQGTVVNSNYQRMTLKVSVNKKVKKWLKMGTSTNISISNSDMLKTATNNKNNGDEGVIRSAVYFPATYSVDEEISYGEYSIVTNPKHYTEALNKNKNYNIYSSNYANVTLAKGLMFRTVLGLNFSINRANRYFPKFLYEGKAVNGKSQAGDNTWESVLWDNLLMYNRTFKKHAINATVGTSWQTSEYYNKMIVTHGFGTDNTNGWILGDGANPQIPNSSKGESQMLSYIGRIAYNYDNRYFLTGTFRRDASSKFAKNNKAAYFPSVGLAWRVSEESFMKSVDMISNLKLRYSYGASGNSGIGSYGSLALFQGANYPFGSGINNGYAPDPTRPGNPDLKWETTHQHDLGLDLSLWGKVDLAIDYYDKKTNDLIQNRKEPPSSGKDYILANIGSVRNKGLEVSLSANLIQTKDFSWSVGVNYSTNKNEVTKVGEVGEMIFPNSLWSDMRPFVITEGKPIGQLYGLVEQGIWGSREDVINSKQFKKVYPDYNVTDNDPATERIINQKWIGEIRFVDFDDSGDITDADRTFIGDVNPDFFYGLNMNFTYKKFDFSFLFQGVSGNDIINMSAMRFHNIGETRNLTKEVLDGAWTPEKGGTNPKIYNDSGRKMLFTRRFVEDGSYLKLRNLSIGYTLNRPFKGVSKMRASITGNNLFTITNYSGFDPEVNAFGSDPSLRGVDAGGYPQSREVSMNLNITF